MSNSLQESLRQSGYSATKQREVVFSVLKKNGALTIADLTTQCSPIANRASVYRTIQLFEKLGYVRRIYQGWKYKLELSDTFGTHHHHIMCGNCGATNDLSDDPRLKTVLKTMAKSSGYRILNHELEIIGICPGCQQKS